MRESHPVIDDFEQQLMRDFALEPPEGDALVVEGVQSQASAKTLLVLAGDELSNLRPIRRLRQLLGSVGT